MNRTFEVDWDSYKDVDELRHKLKIRALDLLPARITKREKNRRLMKQYQAILETDTSHLYDGEYDPREIYYVYAHMDSSKKVAINYNAATTFAATLGMSHFPFYIGKGQGNRAYQINRNETHRKIKQRLEEYGREVLVHIIKDKLSEKDAFILEDKLIDAFRLKVYGGYLTNLDEGNRPAERRLLYPDPMKSVDGVENPEQTRGATPRRFHQKHIEAV
jgi:hypothetical protein